ncbi:MAG TPA: alpha-rhamnosidase, partial [Saprospiraceae bacterium]|nr:alpha-rhamnosidase [Saprospiraceae bacterium]
MSSKSFLPFFLLLSNFIFAQNAPVPRGLLQNYWQARWIAHPTAPAAQYGVFHFRKTFNLPEKPTRFVVHVSADHRYQLFVNGRSVSRGPARSDTWHWNFESLDISPFLQ